MTSTQRLTRLLSDILDLSRIEAGKLEMRNGPLDLVDLLSSVEQLFRPSFEQKNVKLRINTSKSLTRTLIGDDARVQQVLNNLIGNALKFTEKGVVDVEAHPLPVGERGNCRVLFSVKDTGVGISEEKLEKLFEAFTQVEESYRRQHQGAGLGLTISKQLVNLMGGNISVASEPGIGTSFYFCLPFETGDVQPKINENVVKDIPVQGLRLLIAEDDRVNLLATRKLIEKYGWQVWGVENGIKAIKALEQEEFDLVLMDIQMPEMDGIEATQAIRRGDAGEANKAIPIIALTAYAMDGDKETFLEAGMDDYLAKPVGIAELKEVLKRVMDAKRVGNKTK